MGQTKASLKKEPRHVRIYKRQVQSDAWRALSPSAVKVLIALLLYDYGTNNGEIYFSERLGADVTGLCRNTVRRTIAELIDKGFVYRTTVGSFSRKTAHASEYGLTWQGGPPGPNRAPSHAYEKWKVEFTRAQISLETGAVSNSEKETTKATGAKIAPVILEKRLVSNAYQMSDIGPQTVHHGDVKTACLTDGIIQNEKTQEPWQATLRDALLSKLAEAKPGAQTELSDSVGIPGGTLTKFKYGKPLPRKYRAPLSKELGLFEAKGAANRRRRALRYDLVVQGQLALPL